MRDPAELRAAKGGAARRGAAWPFALLVVAAGLLVYANSFPGAFIFDDLDAIVLNTSIQKLWAVADVLNPPAQKPVAGRPVLNLTFAINYAFGKLDPRGYHAVNLAIHLVAGLLLFGVVRRVLLGERCRGPCGSRAGVLAGVIALLWVVHPLQTESVTYVVQRAEALVGLFYLLTLYAVVRGTQADRRARRLWFVGAVGACGLGMATKENMATAPIVAMLLDRAVFAGSLGDVLRRRWPVYVGLAATWLILAGLMAAGPRSESAGFSLAGMTTWDYAKSQPLVILQYLRLALWPHPLCLDYDWPIVRSWSAIVIPVVVLITAALAGLWTWRRWPGVGFLAVGFFISLAPTSSFVPLKDLAFEHRMYLPLATVVALLVLLGDRLLDCVSARAAVPAARAGWIKLAAVLVVVGVWGGLTIRRNTDYRSAERMWSDVVAKRPENARALASLGVACAMAGRHQEALDAYERALRVDPRQPSAKANIGRAFSKLGRYEESVAAYREALEQNPGDTQVRYSLGIVLERMNRIGEALDCYRDVCRREPGHMLAWLGVGICLQRQGDFQAATEAYRKVLTRDKKNVDARCNLAACLERLGRPGEAIVEYSAVLRMQPAHPAAKVALDALRAREEAAP